jgi:phage tail sheath gpL-like
MAVGFATIPADLRVPLFYAEFDASQANNGLASKRALLVGQPTTAESGLAFVASAEEASAFYGQGSMLSRMIRAFRANDPFGELWVFPVADDAAGTAATKTVTITGTATGAGTLALYIGGTLVPVLVAVGDTPTVQAGNIVAAVNANTRLPFTAANSAGVVTLTARNKGTLANSIDVRMNLAGRRQGEVLPAGVSVAIAAGTTGATDPALTGLAAALGDEEFEVIVAPYTATAQINALRDMMNDTSGRWAWSRQLYGHVFAAMKDSSANLLTFGAARNDQHMTVVGYEAENPTSQSEMAAAFAGQVFASIRADAARPLQTLELRGVLPTPTGNRFTKSVQQSLLTKGVALVGYDAAGSVRILRAVTTYQKNAWGQTDISYLDCETLFTLAEVVRRLRGRITQRFPRSKLANDGTRFGAGQPIVTPRIIKAELVAQYAEMVEAGLCEDAEGFAAATIVERNANDPSRVDVLYAPNLVNGLRIFAVLAQFRS